MNRRPIRLMWKLEERVRDDGDDGGDMGPAWLDTLGTDGRVLASERVNGGDWITRDDARKLAEANGYDLRQDDGSTSTDKAATRPAAEIDVDAVNAQLRAAGITEDELIVEKQKGGFLAVTGSLADEDMPPGLQTPPDELEELVLRSMHLPRNATELFELLDDFAPGWGQEKSGPGD